MNDLTLSTPLLAGAFDPADRYAVLRSYGVLDTPPEPSFDQLTELAARITRSPMAAVSLLEEHRQWLKSNVGMTLTETPIEHSFCAHAVEQAGPMTVANATRDPRFASNPLVLGEPSIRAYAGVPLVSPEGTPLGTLCVLDRVPRAWTVDEIDQLSLLASMVMRELEMRRVGLSYRSLFRDHPTPMWVVDVSTQLILDVNEVALEKYGYSRREFLSLNMSALYSPSEANALRLGDPITPPFERVGPVRHLTSTGAVMHVEVESRAVMFENRAARLVQARDVSAEVTWRRAHQETEQRFRLLVDTVEEYAIVLLDPTGRLVSWNQGARRLYGFSEEQVIGSHVSRFFPDGAAARPTVAAHLQEASSLGIHRLTVQHRRSDGSPFWAEVVLTPLRDEQGHALGFAQITRDISLRVAHEQVLIESRDRAERTSRLKSRYLAQMGHEVRTPLTGIIGLAELLGESDSALVAEFARSIRRNGHRLLETLDTVLEYVRLEDHVEPLPVEPIYTRALLEHLASRFNARAVEAGLLFEVTTDAPPVLGHEDALRRTFDHLLRNALTFTPSGRISLRVFTEGSQVHFELEDSGVGMSDEFVARAFEPFQQEAFEGDGQGGSGLGLTIARMLTERMGGLLTATSTKGVGSCFRVTLPLAL